MNLTSIWFVAGSLAALLCAMSVTVFADMGPKPSVRVTFKNLPEGPVYGTLLSKTSSTGPASAWDGDPEHAYIQPGAEDSSVWQAFVDYQDPDGYYFLQWYWDCAAEPLEWTYYPPSDFKILLYFPESGTFASSQICQRHAFDSYFNATLKNGVLTAKLNNQVQLTEVWGLLCRMAITVAVELLIGLLIWCLFRFVPALQFITTVITMPLAAMWNSTRFSSSWCGA